MATTLTACPYSGATTQARVNLAPNPIPGVLAGWSSLAGTGGTAALLYEPRAAPQVSTDGELIPTVARLRYTQGTASTSAGGPYATIPAGSITPGVTYTASLYVTCSPDQGMRLRITYRNAAAATLATFTGETQAVTNTNAGYSRLSVSGLAPAGATSATVEAYSTGALAAGAVIAVTGLLFEAANAVRPYFDGSMPSGPGYRIGWSGAAHASTSTWTVKAPGVGALTVRPRLVVDYAAVRESATILHPVVDRVGPVPTLGSMGLRTGTLDVWCDDHATALAIEQVHTQTGMVLLADTDTPGLGMYYVPTTVEVRPYVGAGPADSPDRWHVLVEYAEVYADGATW